MCGFTVILNLKNVFNALQEKIVKKTKQFYPHFHLDAKLVKAVKLYLEGIKRQRCCVFLHAFLVFKDFFRLKVFFI